MPCKALVMKMEKVTVKFSFYRKYILLMLIPALLSRVMRIAYSNAESDVTVSPILTEILFYAAIIFTCAFSIAAFTGICSATYNYSAGKGIVMILFYMLVYFLDSAARFAIDYFDGVWTSYNVMLEFIALSADFFTAFATAFTVWIIALAVSSLHSKSGGKKYTLSTAVIGAFILHFIIPFVIWLCSVISALIKCEFILTSNEITQMVTDGVCVILTYGVFSFILSRIFIKKAKKD